MGLTVGNGIGGNYAIPQIMSSRVLTEAATQPLLEKSSVVQDANTHLISYAQSLC